jgi:hypothetical protein
MKVYSLTVRNRFTATLVALAVLGVGAALLTVGLMLLAGLAVAGGVLGTGIVLYHRLRGTRPTLPRSMAWREVSLDPSLEVFPDARIEQNRTLPRSVRTTDSD